MNGVASIVCRQTYVLSLLLLSISGWCLANPADDPVYGNQAFFRTVRPERTQSKQTIWYEDFDLTNGTTSDGGPTAWTLTTSRNRTSVQAGRLTTDNDEGSWTSAEIDISAYAEVKIAVDIEGTGSMENADSLQVYYTIDGGPNVPFTNGLWSDDNDFAETTAMIGEVSGGRLRVIVVFRSNENGEQHFIDNVRIYTEPSGRHAIQNGNWDDPNTWSYTSGGPPCLCVPNLLSDTHIAGYTVDVPTRIDTRNLTIHNAGTLRWSASSQDLSLWGDATLDVQDGGSILYQFSNSIKFNQWNSIALDNETDRLGESYPGVDVVINVDDPVGFQAYELAFNAQGSYTIQGSGNMQLFEDFDINHWAQLVNNLAGEIRVAQRFKFHYQDITFTNNGTIIVDQHLWYRNNNGHLINNGSFEAAGLEIDASAGSQITNTSNGSLVITGLAEINNNELTIENEGSIELAGDIQNVKREEFLFYNRTGAVWTLGGGLISDDIYLFAGEANNEVHYNGITDQRMLVPRDVNDPTQEGAYWHLTLSNKRTSGTGPRSTKTLYPSGPPSQLTIEGNLTIIGSVSGETGFDVDNTDTNVNIGGDWEQVNDSFAAFTEGDETVTFDGANDQTLRTNEKFQKFILNKSGGALLVTKGARIKKDATFVNGILTVAAGSSLVFQPLSQTSGASDASHVRGAVTREGSAGSNFTFPVGNGTHYRPISISNLSAASGITAEHFSGTPPDATLKPGEMVNLGSCGYWQLESSVPTAQAFVTLHWDEDCPVDINELVVARWNGTQWVSEGRGMLTGSATGGSLTTPVAINDFGLFALAEITDLPVANNDATTTEEDTPVAIDVAFNRDNTSGINEDTDANGLNPASIRIVTLPQHGTVSVDPSSGIVTYVPEADYNNDTATPDIFTYAVEDTKGVVSNEAMVSVTVTPVNDAPRVTDDRDTIDFATVLEAVSVLANDTDIEGDDFTASLVNSPTNGILDFRPNGTYTYAPSATFSGSDSFTYQACDDGTPSACATATVTVTVRPFNYAPQTQDDNFTTEEDQVLEGNLTTNDTDINPDDALTVDVNPLQAPQHGTVALQSDGGLVYTPEANFFGVDSLAYHTCDNGEPVLCDTAWVIIRVTPVNDAPVAVDDEFSTTEGEGINGEVLANDYDVESAQLGEVTLVGLPSFGMIVLQASGSFTYEPQNAYVGEDRFTYQVCDDQDVDLCSQATVTLRVQAGPLAIPKGFSPNGDGQGDQWILQGILGYPGSLVTIFNRWGNMVFQVMGYDNQNIVWTGESERGVRLGSNRLPEGTYFYVIDLGEGRKPLSGYVLLKR